MEEILLSSATPSEVAFFELNTVSWEGEQAQKCARGKSRAGFTIRLNHVKSQFYMVQPTNTTNILCLVPYLLQCAF